MQKDSPDKIPISPSIDEIVDGSDVIDIPSRAKIMLVDIGGSLTYGFFAGGTLDICAGLNMKGIVISRAYNTVINIATGAPYGWWREQAYRLTNTLKQSHWLRKAGIDFLAYNTFHTPMYTAGVGLASLVSEGEIDLEKVKDGAQYCVMISPLISPTWGWFLDRCRKMFGIKSAAESPYSDLK